MKKKYYWKVVTKHNDGTFHSALVKGKFSLSYELGKQTDSAMDENGIFIFNTRKQAREWRFGSMCRPTSRILKVETLGTELPWDNISIYSLYHMQVTGEKIIAYYHKPEGTTSFPSVIPVEISR